MTTNSDNTAQPGGKGAPLWRAEKSTLAGRWFIARGQGSSAEYYRGADGACVRFSRRELAKIRADYLNTLASRAKGGE